MVTDEPHAHVVARKSKDKLKLLSAMEELGVGFYSEI